jgi:hypothetical protein
MDSEFGCQLPGFERTGRSNCIVGGAVNGRRALILVQPAGEKALTLKFLKIFVDQPKIVQDSFVVTGKIACQPGINLF